MKSKILNDKRSKVSKNLNSKDQSNSLTYVHEELKLLEEELKLLEEELKHLKKEKKLWKRN